MHILTVNTADRGGGAERRAWTLFQGFARSGHDSWMAVGDRHSDDPKVVPFFQSRHIDYRPYSGGLYRMAQRIRKWVSSALGREDFDFPFSKYVLQISGTTPDVVHCQNLHGGYFDLRVLESISKQVPVFLTLHDSWAFTGHCAAPGDCERWRSGCGACPDLATPPALRRDGTHANWRRKRDIYAGARLRVAAPSEWLLKRARESILGPAMVESRVIRPGVDLEFFKPGSRPDARQQLDIPQDAVVLLYVANGGRANPFKDFGTLHAAASRLAQVIGDRPLWLVTVGGDASEETQGWLRVVHVPYQVDKKVLARYYQAADLYVHSTRSEAFGLVIAEAMACGLPIVATRIGGIPEVFTEEVHGLLVPQGAPGSMAEAMESLIRDAPRRQRMGVESSEYARSRYSDELMISSYLEWFQQAL